MKMQPKSLVQLCFLVCFFLCACSGPAEKSPLKTEKREFPEKAYSQDQQPKDGTDVETDTTTGQ